MEDDGQGGRDTSAQGPGRPMKSLRPKSEFCACPLLPHQHVRLVHGWSRPVSNRAFQGWPLQLQLTATIWDMNPVLLDLLSLLERPENMLKH